MLSHRGDGWLSKGADGHREGWVATERDEWLGRNMIGRMGNAKETIPESD